MSHGKRASAIASAVVATLAAVVCPALPGVAAPAAADAPVTPRVSNTHEVAERLMDRLLSARVGAEGTVYASFRIAADGSVVPLQYYGRLAQHAAFGPIVRAATADLKFDVPDAWAAAHPDRVWVAFWMFQKNACRPEVYDAPAAATTIRVCADVQQNQLDPGASDVRFDAPKHVPTLDRPLGLVQSRPLVYPRAAIRDRVQGTTLVNVTIDPRGRVTAASYVLETAGATFRGPIDEWLSTARFAVPPGWDVSRPHPLRVSFALRTGDACAWTLPGFDGTDLRICEPMR